MTTGQQMVHHSHLLAYIKHNPCFEDDYRDFKDHSIKEILNELRTRDEAEYHACTQRLGIKLIH